MKNEQQPIQRRDVFFLQEYGKLYEEIENAKFDAFSFECTYGKIYYQYLKRPIPFLVDGVQYYDIMTPYGYGGPFVESVARGHEDDLRECFRKALDQHLLDERVVCEFVRFYPMVDNAAFFEGMYQLRNHRTAVLTDCSADDPVRAEFHPDTVRRIKQANRKGITARVIVSPKKEELDRFILCYYENMKCIGAKEYFFFSRDFFYQMSDALKEYMVLTLACKDDDVLGGDLGFLGNDVWIRFLSGVTIKGKENGVSRVLIDAQVRRAKEHGLRYVFHGCGLTASNDDPLLRYKRFFTKGCYRTYWQGSRIVQPILYRRMCEITGQAEGDDYFPAYRRPKEV